MSGASKAISNDACHVSLIHASEMTAKFQEEWLDLTSNAETPNPFFVPWFLNPALQFLDDDNDARICTVRREGELIGLAPITVGSTYSKVPLKHFSVWKHDHCYNGAPLIRCGCDALFYETLSAWIDTHPEGARFIRLTQCPYSQEFTQVVSILNAQSHSRLRLQKSHERAILTQQQKFEAHLATVYSGKKRKELRRQAKRFEELGTASFESLPIDKQTIESFITLENAGWKNNPMDGFPIARSDAERAFFTEAMLAGAEQGGATCLSLVLNNNPVAMLFSLHAGGRQYAFKTTYDEKYAIYSPGTRLIIEATRRMLEDPSITFFDSCAKAGHPLMDSLWPERLRITELNIIASGTIDKSLLSLAASLENLKTAVTSHFRQQQPVKTDD